MNTNPDTKRILCFGDSNTRGWIPLATNKPIKRYAANIRWTGVLQNLLGEKFEIIEEGLDARTTVTDDLRSNLEGKNELKYLKACLDSHKPLNLVILMLGTTETKEMLNMGSNQIAEGVEQLLQKISTSNSGKLGKSPKILLISPPIIEENIDFAAKLFMDKKKKSEKLAQLYKSLAGKYECEFLDTTQLISVSKKDSVHLESEEHSKLGKLIYKKIKNMCEDSTFSPR